jgi:C-terminal processing protease CtpA/Prc
MPTAQSISPITHTNWEAKGVQPDVRVPAGSALETATALILRQLRKTAARGDINP